MKVTNKSGYTLHGIVEGDEEALITNHQPLTASVVILRVKHKFLFGFNRNRKQWELPGGRIEDGETPGACAIRAVSYTHLTLPTICSV